MELKLNLQQNTETEKETRRRVEQATAKKMKAQYEPKWSEVWNTGYETHTGRFKAGILQSKVSDNDRKKLLEVKKAVENGEIGVGTESLKKFTKAHALRLYKELQEARREQIIADMIEHKPANYWLIDNALILGRFIELLAQEELIALDTETTGVDVHGKDYTVGMSISLDKADIHAYIPYRHLEKYVAGYNADGKVYATRPVENQLSPEVVFNAVKPHLENENIKKVLHNAKFDFHMLRKDGIQVKGLLMDTMVAMHVLNENEPSFALKNLATKYGSKFGFEDKSSTYEELFGKGGFEYTPLDIGHIYACKDTHLTLQFYKWLDSHLKARPELHNIYYNIERETTLVCIEMEKNGFEIDFEYAEKYKKELTQQVQELESQIREGFGDININSNQQLQEAIFTEWGLAEYAKELGIKEVTTGGGTGFDSKGRAITIPVKKSYPVDASTLKSLTVLEDKVPQVKHIKTLLEYRELHKLLSTYIEPLPQKVGTDGRLHGEFKQSGTKTGRFSSSNPNLQNLPYPARGLVVAPAGKIIIGIDYSQIEPRVLSHISKDKHLQEPYLTGKDLYSTLASRVFKVPIEECGDGSKYRKMMKTGLLAVMYGTSTFTLSQQLNISVEEAEQFIEDFMDTYPDVKAFIEETHHVADTKGYTQTLQGRKRRFLGHAPIAKEYHRITAQIEKILGRPFKNIWQEQKIPRELKMKYWSVAKNYGRVSRQSVNAIIQGTSADIMKMAMINLYKHLLKKGSDWKLVGTIHDEVLIEIPATATPEEIEELENIMKSALPISVPYKVDTEVSARWGSGVPKAKWIEAGCGRKVFGEEI